MKKLSIHSDANALIKHLMADIEVLIEAIAAEQPDCDLMLAELLEGEPEAVRQAIIKKLQEMLKVRAEEKERELTTLIEKEQRREAERKRGQFRQWLQWMMSEETIRKMREAFLAIPLLERAVRSVGRDMAARGMSDIQLGNKRDLGELSHNAPLARGQDKGKGQGRE